MRTLQAHVDPARRRPATHVLLAIAILMLATIAVLLAVDLTRVPAGRIAPLVIHVLGDCR